MRLFFLILNIMYSKKKERKRERKKIKSKFNINY